MAILGILENPVSLADLSWEDQREAGIYRIRNLLDGKIYIGSAKNLYSRWAAHRSCLYKHKHHAHRLEEAWYRDSENVFIFEIIEFTILDKDILLGREQFWLDTLTPYNPDIGYNESAFARSRLGVKASDKTRALQSSRRKGVSKSPEHAAAIATALKKSPIAAEQRARLHISSKGRPKSEDHRRNLSAAREGTKRTPETSAKISAAHLGKKLSLKHCESIRISKIGRPRTACAKESMKAGWARRKERLACEREEQNILIAIVNECLGHTGDFY